MTPPDDGFLLAAFRMPLARENIVEKIEFRMPSEKA